MSLQGLGPFGKKAGLPPLVLSERSSKVMKIAVKTSQILHSYFKSAVCIHEEELSNEFAMEMLIHFHLFGGCVRDLILGADVNDMDTNVETRELCKIQANHLREYHSTEEQQSDEGLCKCFVWQLYMHNVNDDTKQENLKLLADIKEEFEEHISDKKWTDAKVKESYLYASGCNYVPNARYWVNLLMQLEPFKSNPTRFKLQKYELACWNIYALDAVGDEPLMFEDVDFAAFSLDIADPLMNSWKASNAHYLQVDPGLKYVLKRRWSISGPRKMLDRRRLMAQNSALCLANDDDLGDFSDSDFSDGGDLIPIHVPICEVKLRKRMEALDLTINMLALPFSTLVNTKSLDELDTGIIRNVVDGNEAMEDVVNHVLRAGPSLKSVMEFHSPCTHWWRVVKAKMKFVDFTIDPRLLRVHIECYAHWLAVDGYFEDKSVLDNFMYGFHVTMSKANRDNMDAFVGALDALNAMEVFSEAVMMSKTLRDAMVCEMAKAKFSESFTIEDCAELFEQSGISLKQDLLEYVAEQKKKAPEAEVDADAKEDDVKADDAPDTGIKAEDETEAKSEVKAEETKDSASKSAKVRSPFYKYPQKPRILIGGNNRSRKSRRSSSKLNTFVEKAKRLLRSNETITVHGIEDGMTTACTLVEILKREKVAVVNSLSTNVNLQQRYTQRSACFERGFLSMDFVLGRGENALFVMDSKQNTLVGIFETKDTEHSGALPKDVVEAFDMAEAFYSTETQKAAASAFLATLGAEVSLPDFVKYASALIDVNLRNHVFLKRADEKYGVSSLSKPTV